MLAKPLAGIYDPSRFGWIPCSFFGAMAETDRENTLEGLNTAVRKENHGGRLPVIIDDMIHTAGPPRERRVGGRQPTGSDPPRRRTQRPEPEPRQHLTRAGRTRKTRGVPRGRRTGPHRLHRTPNSQLTRTGNGAMSSMQTGQVSIWTPIAVGVIAFCRATRCQCRSCRKKARTSSTNRSGTSNAGKCPPSACSRKKATLSVAPRTLATSGSL